MLEFISTYWEGIVAGFALMTSIFTAAILFYTFRLQRSHYIKSAKPIVHIGQWDYEDRIFVTLVNLGTGVALIKRIKVLNIRDESKNCIYDWLPKKLPGAMNYNEYWTGFKDFAVQAGQEIILIKVPIDINNTEQRKVREEIRSILRQLTIKVQYQDIYENEMPEKSMNLHLFSRTDNEN